MDIGQAASEVLRGAGKAPPPLRGMPQPTPQVPEGPEVKPLAPPAEVGVKELSEQPTKQELQAYAAQQAKERGIDPATFLGLIDHETGGEWDNELISPKKARGLTQLMPGTSADEGEDPTDPYANIRMGASYFSKQLKKYNGDVKLALAAYNAGPKAVDDHGGVPPYKETQNYVADIPKRAMRFGPMVAGLLGLSVAEAANKGQGPTKTAATGQWRSWDEVAEDPQFQALDNQQQEIARQQYFKTVVAPRVEDPNQIPEAARQFDAYSKPGMLGKLGHAIKQAIAPPGAPAEQAAPPEGFGAEGAPAPAAGPAPVGGVGAPGAPPAAATPPPQPSAAPAGPATGLDPRFEQEVPSAEFPTAKTPVEVMNAIAARAASAHATGQTSFGVYDEEQSQLREWLNGLPADQRATQLQRDDSVGDVLRQIDKGFGATTAAQPGPGEQKTAPLTPDQRAALEESIAHFNVPGQSVAEQAAERARIRHQGIGGGPEASNFATRGYRDFEAGVVGSTGAMLTYMARKTGAYKLTELGDAMVDWSENKMPATPTFADKAVNAIGSAASFFVPGLGVYKGTTALAILAPTAARWAGATTMGVLGGAMSADAVYKTNLAKGMPEPEAAAAADTAFWINAGMQTAIDRFGFFNQLKSFAAKVTAGAGAGTATMVPQTIVQNYLTDEPLMANVPESAALGAIAGGVMAGGHHLLGGKPHPEPAPGQGEELKPGGLDVKLNPVNAFMTAEELVAAGAKRLETLDKKASGTPESTATDPETGKSRKVPGEQPQFLSDAEKAERTWLRENGQDVQKLAKAYNIAVEPTGTPTAEAPEARIEPTPPVGVGQRIGDRVQRQINEGKGLPLEPGQEIVAPKELGGPAEPKLGEEPVIPKRTLVTSKGNFEVHEDGTTTREGGERSEGTVYLEPRDSDRLSKAVRDGVKPELSKDGSEIIADKLRVRVHSEPDEGLRPVELFARGQRLEFGPTIESIRGEPEPGKPEAPARVEPQPPGRPDLEPKLEQAPTPEEPKRRAEMELMEPIRGKEEAVPRIETKLEREKLPEVTRAERVQDEMRLHDEAKSVADRLKLHPIVRREIGDMWGLPDQQMTAAKVFGRADPQTLPEIHAVTQEIREFGFEKADDGAALDVAYPPEMDADLVGARARVAAEAGHLLAAEPDLFPRQPTATEAQGGGKQEAQAQAPGAAAEKAQQAAATVVRLARTNSEVQAALERAAHEYKARPQDLAGLVAKLNELVRSKPDQFRAALQATEPTRVIRLGVPVAAPKAHVERAPLPPRAQVREGIDLTKVMVKGHVTAEGKTYAMERRADRALTHADKRVDTLSALRRCLET